MRRPLLPLLVVPLDLIVGVGLAVGWPFWWLLALHLVAAVATGWAWKRAWKDWPLVSLRAGMVTLCFPVVGSFAVWLAAPGAGAGGSALVDEYRNFIAYETPTQAMEAVKDADEALRRELSVRPLVEVLRRGDLAAKQGAAAALAESESAEAVRQLRLALVDPDDETRLFASLGLVQMEEAFLGRLKSARDRHTLASSPESAMALATEARRYAESGLPAEGVARAFWEEAEGAALTATADPAPEKAVSAWLIAARARLALGRIEAAKEACRRALAARPDDPQALEALMEAHYAMGDLDAVRALAPALAGAVMPESESADRARYWGGGPSTGAGAAGSPS